MTSGDLHRLTAFAESDGGGNPAGVWLGDELPDDRSMQRIAADVGFSETAFVAPRHGNERTVRYFSPEIEVPFCGHATIALGTVLGSATHTATYQLSTAVGVVPITVQSRNGRTEVSLTTVDTKQKPVSDKVLDDALAALRWRKDELDPAIPPVIAFAGIWHLVIAVNTIERLAQLDYDFEALKALMQRAELATLQLVWRENDTLFHARNPFPIGGVVEDPATGSAAAALGGYLRDAGLIVPPASFVVRQGETMGRPSRICVDVPETGGMIVSGSATRIPE